jgi:hypothetical protein
MSNELQKSTGLLAVIERATMSPDANVENIERLYTLYEKDQARLAEQAYAEAMSSCQAEMPMVARNAENKQTSSQYAKHEAICKAITPIYTKHGFSLSFYEGKAEQTDYIRIMCDVSHKQGHTKQRFIDFPIDNIGMQGKVNKTMIHGKGSTFSYGRRYLTLLIFDLATYDDNDGTIAPRITEDQVNQLHAKITENDLSLDKFLKWAKVDQLVDIPERAFDVVNSEVDRAIKQKAKK